MKRVCIFSALVNVVAWWNLNDEHEKRSSLATSCAEQAPCIKITSLEKDVTFKSIDDGPTNCGDCTYKLCIQVNTGLKNGEGVGDGGCSKNENEGFSQACIPPPISQENFDDFGNALCSRTRADHSPVDLDDYFSITSSVSAPAYNGKLLSSGMDISGKFGNGLSGGAEICALGAAGTTLFFAFKDGGRCKANLDPSTVNVHGTSIDFECGLASHFNELLDNEDQCNGGPDGGYLGQCIWSFTLPKSDECRSYRLDKSNDEINPEIISEIEEGLQLEKFDSEMENEFDHLIEDHYLINKRRTDNQNLRGFKP